MAEVFKILRDREYRQLISDGRYIGSEADVRDGFIHLSAADQWEATRAKWFASDDELWLIGIDATALGTGLRWEVSRGGVLFPHLYRALLASDIVSARQLFRAA